jgi:uncharacterized circularly permuted ATP-grasp superfamily protein/uncharacterized alpha-E superfamily protein
MDALGGLGLGALKERRREAHRQLNESGVTYTVHGDPGGHERAWSLDPLPMLVSSAEWREIELGLMQRAELMNLVFKDLYGPQALIRRGILPAEVVYAHDGFLRACHPLDPKASHPLSLYAVDLVRGPDGGMWVLNDRTQSPSGAGYALINRMTMARVLPSLFRDSNVHRLALFFQNLRASLAALSPRPGDDPRIVVLTPGPLNETYFEHSYLASYLGYALARGDDLTVQGGRVWLRTMRRLERVDVILRRVDDHYCDPLELRSDSRLGVPGLVQAVRSGSVAMVNPLGASLLENPALNAFLPAIARHLLGQDLKLPSAASWWCGQANEREYVLENLERLVIKPIYRAAGARPVFAGMLTRKARERLAERIRARPWRYVGQEQLDFSVVPTLVDDGLEARHSVLRSFLVARDDGYSVMPGGLTRIAPNQDSFVVSNQAGGLSKDTWILASEPEKQVSLLPHALSPSVTPNLHGDLPGGTAENLFWFARYAERAEQGARLLRTVLHLYRNAVEFHDPADRASLTVLLQVLTHVTTSYPGFCGPQGDAARAEPVAELLALTVDPQRQGGLGFNLRALLAAAYAVRDRISVDTWRVINDIRTKLEVMQERSRTELGDIEDDLDEVITSLVALAGFAQESMLRGQAWLFLDIGRRLERGQLLGSLLRAALADVREPALESILLDGVLTSVESAMAYRRGYHNEPMCEPVLKLLLLDESNPRSLAFQLRTLHAHVELLPREEGAQQVWEQALLIRDALTRLRLTDPAVLVRTGKRAQRGALRSLLERTDELLRDTASGLAHDYFADDGGSQQMIGAGWGIRA